MACPPTAYNHRIVGFVHVRMGGDFCSEFVAVHDTRAYTCTYFYRVRDDATFEFDGRAVVITWTPCRDDWCHDSVCKAGTKTLRPFKSIEEATVASFSVFESLWKRDGDHAVFARVLGCGGIDSTTL